MKRSLQATLIRYYYDQQTQVCRQFSYTGFNGNENNFMTLNACERRCPGAFRRRGNVEQSSYVERTEAICERFVERFRRFRWRLQLVHMQGLLSMYCLTYYDE